MVKLQPRRSSRYMIELAKSGRSACVNASKNPKLAKCVPRVDIDDDGGGGGGWLAQNYPMNAAGKYLIAKGGARRHVQQGLRDVHLVPTSAGKSSIYYVFSTFGIQNSFFRRFSFHMYFTRMHAILFAQTTQEMLEHAKLIQNQCWRVPSKVWLGYLIQQAGDVSLFVQALASMNTVLFPGLQSSSSTTK